MGQYTKEHSLLPESEIEMKAYYRPDEVADLFGVTRRTIYRLIKKRKLSAIKIGASLRIPQADIEKLKKNKK